MWTHKTKQFHFKWNYQQNQIEEGASYESITRL